MSLGYGEHPLFWDVAAAIAGSLVVSQCVLEESAVHALLKDNRAAVYSALASLFGTLAGFTLASVALFLQLSEHAHMARVRRSRHFPKLGAVFVAAVILLSVSTLVCLVALIFDKDVEPRYWLTSLVLVAAGVSLACLKNVIWVTARTVQHYTASSREAAKAEAAAEDAS